MSETTEETVIDTKPSDPKPTDGKPASDTGAPKPKRGRGRPRKVPPAAPSESGADVRQPEAGKVDAPPAAAPSDATVAPHDAKPKGSRARTRKRIRHADKSDPKPSSAGSGGGGGDSDTDYTRIALILGGGLLALGAIWYAKRQKDGAGVPNGPSLSQAAEEVVDTVKLGWQEVEQIAAGINEKLEVRLAQR